MESQGWKGEILQERKEAADGVDRVGEDEGAFVRVVKEKSVKVKILK